MESQYSDILEYHKKQEDTISNLQKQMDIVLSENDKHYDTFQLLNNTIQNLKNQVEAQSLDLKEQEQKINTQEIIINEQMKEIKGLKKK